MADRKFGIVVLVLSILHLSVIAQIKVHGFVHDAASGESLPEAHVYSIKTGLGTLSNRYGSFSIEIPPSGKDSLLISYVGYKSLIVSIEARRDTFIRVPLASGYIMSEYVVEGESVRPFMTSNKLGLFKLREQDISHAGTLLGEPDLMKKLQSLPGISQGKEGSSEIFVRGGGSDQNLIMLDGAPVYNVNHAFGVLSLFNVDAVKEVTVHKNIPVRYGDRLSSVVDVMVRDGNKNDKKGSVFVSTLGAGVTLEGPIVKEKSTWLISARRSWPDLLFTAGNLLANNGDFVPGVSFHDLNVKTSFDLDDYNRLFLSFYTGGDQFFVRSKMDGKRANFKFGWGNHLGSIGWNSLFSPEVFGRLQLHFSSYYDKERVGFRQAGLTDSFERWSRFNELGAKYDVDWQLSSSLLLRTGVAGNGRWFTPAVIDQTFQRESTSDIAGRVNMWGTSLFTEGVWSSGPWRMVAGLRGEMSETKEDRTLLLLPGLSGSYKINNLLTAKGGFRFSSQPFHAVRKSTMGWPGYYYVPLTGRLKRQRARQVSAGFNFIPTEQWNIDVEGYYKEVDNIVAGYDAPASAYAQINWEEALKSGDGRSYGLELFNEFRNEILNLTASYTLSRSQSRFNEYYEGRWFAFDYDRLHDLSLNVGFEFAAPYNTTRMLSFGFVYRTGNPFMLPSSEVYANYPPVVGSDYWYDFSFMEQYSGPNNARMPDYHRLDVSYEIKKKLNRGERIISFGFYNIYNRQNPYLIYNEPGKGYQQMTLFPVLPFFSFKRKY